MLNENIIIGQALNERIKSGKTTLLDNLLIALANFTTGLFPDITTYIGAQSQGAETPSIWIDCYDLNTQRKLGSTDRHDFGAEITYWPEDQAANTEITNVVFMIADSLNTVSHTENIFTCYTKESDITDNVGHVVCNFYAYQQTIADDPLIRIADKELNT
ncbi:MAG: hypothetical protein LBV27_07240 [Oscillospiraceae bacterium]|jgi:hypothetical protein|nr:hypothetical protein [Oscillospiraceae bacterium]